MIQIFKISHFEWFYRKINDNFVSERKQNLNYNVWNACELDWTQDAFESFGSGSDNLIKRGCKICVCLHCKLGPNFSVSGILFLHITITKQWLKSKQLCRKRFLLYRLFSHTRYLINLVGELWDWSIDLGDKSPLLRSGWARTASSLGGFRSNFCLEVSARCFGFGMSIKNAPSHEQSTAPHLWWH